LKKVVQKFWLLLSFSKKLSKENTHPIGENSPNLVTLIAMEGMVASVCGGGGFFKENSDQLVVPIYIH
jgi:hypothetical protein